MSVAELRQQVRELYDFRCGYCEVRETDSGARLTLDHFQPRSRGGSDTRDNLVYCCHACNEFKGDYWQPESERRILHPLRDLLAEHLVTAENGRMRALTATGEFHLRRLCLNREALVAHRREQNILSREREEQQAVLGRIAQLEQRVETLQTLVAGLVPQPKNNEPS